MGNDGGDLEGDGWDAGRSLDTPVSWDRLAL